MHTAHFLCAYKLILVDCRSLACLYGEITVCVYILYVIGPFLRNGGALMYRNSTFVIHSDIDQPFESGTVCMWGISYQLFPLRSD